MVVMMMIPVVELETLLATGFGIADAAHQGCDCNGASQRKSRQSRLH
jgi:hypothetical protein